jgi:hypothetical protein
MKKFAKLLFEFTFTHGIYLILPILKLCGVIDWSWLWTLAPIWLPIALVLALLIFVAFGLFIVTPIMLGFVIFYGDK